MSGYMDDAIVRHGILEENMAFIGKPFTGEKLTEMVRKIAGAQDLSSGNEL